MTDERIFFFTKHHWIRNGHETYYKISEEVANCNSIHQRTNSKYHQRRLVLIWVTRNHLRIIISCFF